MECRKIRLSARIAGSGPTTPRRKWNGIRAWRVLEFAAKSIPQTGPQRCTGTLLAGLENWREGKTVLIVDRHDNTPYHSCHANAPRIYIADVRLTQWLAEITLPTYVLRNFSRGDPL